MKYVLVGYYGFGNCGDSASLYKVKKLILSLDHNAQFKVFYPKKSSCKTFINRWSFFDIIKSFLWSDKIVFGGGSILQNTTSSLSLYYYLILILLGKLCKKKVVLLGQGIGPVAGTIDYALMSFCLKFVDKLSARDNYSFTIFKLNIKKSIVLSSDITLFNEKKILTSQVQDMSVGFALKPSFLDVTLLDQLHLHIKKTVDNSVYYTFFPEQDKQIYNDLGIVGSAQIQVKNLFNQDNLPKVKIMVVMRYHAAIWCALNGIPFLALATDPKLDSIAKSLEQEYVSLYDVFDDDIVLKRQFDVLVANFDDYQAKLIQNIDQLIDLSEKHKELFYETV